MSKTDQATMITRVCIHPDALEEFAEWQSKLNRSIASYQNFISLEIISSHPNTAEWKIIQRFHDSESLKVWQESKERQELMRKVQHFLLEDVHKSMQEEFGSTETQLAGVTEMFVTFVDPDKISAYREWMGKIHQAELKFPGFRRTLVQSPKNEQVGSWITLLQFDTQEHLDNWLNSPERLTILQEGNEFIRSFESHRVISSFSGWFPASYGLEKVPPAWKQTMLVLLVLFPIVMLEIKFLNPHLTSFNPSLATFIGNAISVSLVSWPLIPLSIYFLGWWLNPSKHQPYANALGILIVCVLYLIEIAVLWRLL